MSNVCFSFGMYVLQCWVLGPMCVLVWKVSIAFGCILGPVCVLIWNASITRLGLVSNVCFGFGMEALQGWVIPCPMCVSGFEMQVLQGWVPSLVCV
jgi:hypothetical protein